MLFDASQLSKDEKPLEKSGAFAIAQDSQSASLQSHDAIKQGVAELGQCQCLHFVSRGQWSMHELLEAMLRRSGPAAVFLTTWTVTEDPVRKIFLLKQEGLIKSLSCVLDYRIKGRKPKPFQLLEHTADRIALTQCHAKAAVVRGESLSLTCLSSANFSRNPRIEAGIICEGEAVADFHQSWIEKTITQNEND